MVDSGVVFYNRYANTTGDIPFVRASGSQRVIASAQKFIKGFQRAKTASGVSGDDPKVDVILNEKTGFNNTLNHGSCPNFEKSKLSDEVVDNFTSLFVPPIQNRLLTDLPGLTNLSLTDVIDLMDICPYDTVANADNEDEIGQELSPFCSLFTPDEWIHYDYMQSLKKYYGYGSGNPLGPTQGVGFVNELIARLTGSPVHDHTSTNHTLDSNPVTFPVSKLNSSSASPQLYADFTHDNGLLSIYFALGLYNSTKPLSLTEVQSTAETDGFSSAWTVPFGARAYIEAMWCDNESEPLVRVLVNDRVVPLHGCNVDHLGRCKLDDFVQALSFARDGGYWDDCFG